MREEVPATGGQPVAIASWRHTAILTGIFMMLAAAGAFFQSGHGKSDTPAGSRVEVLPTYLSFLALEWGLVFYIWRGALRPRGMRFSELIGGRWSRARDMLPDIGLGAAVWICWVGIQKGWDMLFGTIQAGPVSAYLPRHPLENILWIALSISAGFCEELAFRGYFQRQYGALTKSRVAGLLLQAVLFGVSHGYQGLAATVKIALFGLLFGGLAWWRKSLRPGMMAHAWSDINAGWLQLL
jgi:membrane protease YdiL (CAAX protease family)